MGDALVQPRYGHVALPVLKDDYYGSMHWSTSTGHLACARATELGMAELLDGYLE